MSRIADLSRKAELAARPETWFKGVQQGAGKKAISKLLNTCYRQAWV